MTQSCGEANAPFAETLRKTSRFPVMDWSPDWTLELSVVESCIIAEDIALASTTAVTVGAAERFDSGTVASSTSSSSKPPTSSRESSVGIPMELNAGKNVPLNAMENGSPRSNAR